MSTSFISSDKVLFFLIVLDYKFIKQVKISGMKEMYVKPEIQVMEFEAEGVLCCSSCSDGDPGASAPDFGWDDSWPTSSIW